MDMDLCGLVFPVVLYLRELRALLVLLESQRDSLFFFYWYAQKEAWFSYLVLMIFLLEIYFRLNRKLPNFWDAEIYTIYYFFDRTWSQHGL